MPVCFDLELMTSGMRVIGGKFELKNDRDNGKQT